MPDTGTKPRYSPLFRSSRPDYIETRTGIHTFHPELLGLFRSSRPDYIETGCAGAGKYPRKGDCSGLPDRTTLRRRFRGAWGGVRIHCSGLPDRTTLRPKSVRRVFNWSSDCSGLPDRTTLRRVIAGRLVSVAPRLFRSSRPDYIEISGVGAGLLGRQIIVPVFQTGLH